MRESDTDTHIHIHVTGLMQMMGLEEELVRMLGQDCPIPVTYAGGSELMVSLFVCIGMTNAFTDFKHTHPTPPPRPPPQGDLDRVKAIGGGGVDLTIGRYVICVHAHMTSVNCMVSLWPRRWSRFPD